MKTIEQLLGAKNTDIWSIDPDGLIFDAITLMAEKEIGALLVIEDERVVGILSERDYARKVLLRGRSSRETPVREIMTSDVIFATPDQTVEDCMTLMTHKRIRHLPVLSNGRLVGVISIGDLVKAVIADQQETIEQLESYIRG
ncbi:MAG: CBS domain-containing protein [Gammaproteobacteria bacterium]|nr:MAG: CBS domain-containing protein [Gammaproteobacteria bacterium]